MRKENIILYDFIPNCTGITKTYFVALLNRKNMIVNYFSYKTKLTLLRKCQPMTSFEAD